MAVPASYRVKETFSLDADVTFAAKQYFGVDFKSGDFTRAIPYVGTAAAGKKPPIGIALADPAAGEALLIGCLQNGSKFPVVYGGNVTAGDRLMFDSNGKAITYAAGAAGTTSWVVGIAMEAGADTETHPVFINLYPIVA